MTTIQCIPVGKFHLLGTFVRQLPYVMQFKGFFQCNLQLNINMYIAVLEIHWCSVLTKLMVTSCLDMVSKDENAGLAFVLKAFDYKNIKNGT